MDNNLKKLYKIIVVLIIFTIVLVIGLGHIHMLITEKSLCPDFILNIFQTFYKYGRLKKTL